MRFIKLGIISFVFIFILVTAISLLIPSHIRISKAINLRAEKDSILALVRDTANWKQWHPVFQTQQGQQAHAALRIKPLVLSDTLITMELSQPGKKPMLNGWQLYQYSNSEALTLQWYMDFHLQWYPWQKFSALFYENIYGTMMEQGLMNIKSTVEN